MDRHTRVVILPLARGICTWGTRVGGRKLSLCQHCHISDFVPCASSGQFLKKVISLVLGILTGRSILHTNLLNVVGVQPNFAQEDVWYRKPCAILKMHTHYFCLAFKTKTIVHYTLCINIISQHSSICFLLECSPIFTFLSTQLKLFVPFNGKNCFQFYKIKWDKIK